MYRAVGLFFICHCKIKAHQFESSDVPLGKTFQKKKANLQVLNVAVQVWFIFWDLKIVSKSQEFQKHLKIMSEDIQIFVSRVSSSPKKSQISMWKTTYTSQGSEGTNWPCCLWPASPASPPPRCPWAQEPHCSSDLGQDAMKRERAMKCSSAKPWQVPTRLLTALLSCTLAQSSPKLDCRYFCVWPCTQLNSTQPQLSSELLTDPTYISDLLCSPGLGTGQLHPARSCCTAAFPELQPGPWFYSSGIQLQAVRLHSSSWG